MKIVRLLPFSIFILLLSVFILPVIAADCPEVVKSALDATNTICSATGRNQACYGNVKLTAEAQADAPPFDFTKPGDLADITGVKKLILSPLDASGNSWGIALLKVQANLPDTLPGQNVSFVLFGDVQIDNAADIVEYIYDDRVVWPFKKYIRPALESGAHQLGNCLL